MNVKRKAAAKTPALLLTASLITAGMLITAAAVGSIFSMTPASAQQTKLLVLHFPSGDPDKAHVICVGAPAAFKHVEEHPGDAIVGTC